VPVAQIPLANQWQGKFINKRQPLTVGMRFFINALLLLVDGAQLKRVLVAFVKTL
jgi:hypothetical protein